MPRAWQLISVISVWAKVTAARPYPVETQPAMREDHPPCSRMFSSLAAVFLLLAPVEKIWV